VSSLGNFYYMSTRNHQFTNRDQKAMISVVPRTDGLAWQPITIFGTLMNLQASSGNAWLRFYPDPLQYTTGTQTLSITESNGIIHVSPDYFDVAVGQQILLEMKYSGDDTLTIYDFYQSFDPNFAIDYQISTSYSGGVASASITQGGYYQLQSSVSPGPVVGIVLAITFVGAGAGFLYWKVKKGFRLGGKKKHLMDDASSPTTGGTEMGTAQRV